MTQNNIIRFQDVTDVLEEIKLAVLKNQPKA